MLKRGSPPTRENGESAEPPLTLDRFPQLWPAVAPLAAEDVTGQAFTVQAHQRHPGRGGPAEFEGDVLPLVGQAGEADDRGNGRVLVGEAQRLVIGRLDVAPGEPVRVARRAQAQPAEQRVLGQMIFGIRGTAVRNRSEVGPALRAAREHPGPALIDFQVEQEDTVYPMVPAGADLGAMIRRPSPLVETAAED